MQKQKIKFNYKNMKNPIDQLSIRDLYELSNDKSINNAWRSFLTEKFRERLFRNLKIWVIVSVLLISLICIVIGYKANADEPRITYDNLNIEGMEKPPFKLYSRLKDECYAQDVEDKEHCIRVGLSIAFAESSWKDNHTPFWLQSKDKSFKKWVSSYKKYWYKWNEWGHFYWYSSDKPAPTRYCMSEESSNSNGFCPNGRKNFNKVFYNLTF